MLFEVTLAVDKDRPGRKIRFECDYDATSVLEQRVYDTIAQENEWIMGIVRIPADEEATT